MDPAFPQAGTKPHARKRNRITLSCGHCRFRKLKCSRTTPCTACVRSGDAATCSYNSSGRREYKHSSTQPPEKEVLTSRIDRLESLLLSALNKTDFQPSHISLNDVSQLPNVSTDTHNDPSSIHEQRAESEPIDMDQLGKEFGVLRVESNQTLYHGGQHWVSTMFQIKEFRDYLEAHSDDLGRVALENRKARDDNISLLQGSNSFFTKEELISSIPPRAVSDILVTRFFDSASSHIPVLHEPTFREEYIEHWMNPTKTDITWLGLLFSIFHHAQLSFNGENDGNNSESYVAEYRELTIHCLFKAKYTDPKMYTIETLILHTYAEWMTSQDSSINVSLQLGIIIRLAMRMGMHRDSKAYGDVSQFQGEMRRRIWTTIRMMDIVCSFQLSLPAAIHGSTPRCDLPRNILNSELGMNTKLLPSARPLSEPTEILITIIKAYLTLELGKILEFAESEDEPTDEEISKYEQSLEAVRRMIPEHLDINFSPESATVLEDHRRKRIDLDRLYQISRCVLHRKSLSQARRNPAKLRQRGICIDAAMILLSHQTTLYLDSNSSIPKNIQKRHIFTLTTHDFFTAAMAVALDLHYGFESEPYTPSPSDMSLWGYDRRNEMITTLETSNEFCKISKADSVEAANAHGMLSLVVAKAKKAQWMIAENEVRESTNIVRQNLAVDVTSPVPELGAEIFHGTLPGFDWNLWGQFNGVAVDASTPWEDTTST